MRSPGYRLRGVALLAAVTAVTAGAAVSAGPAAAATTGPAVTATVVAAGGVGAGAVTPARSVPAKAVPAKAVPAKAVPAASRKAASVAAAAVLRPGSRGAAVLAAQRRLSELGYWLGAPNAVYGEATRHAVVALQKAAGLSRDGVLGPKTRVALERGVVPSARSRSGRAIEIDLDRQLLLVVRSGRVVRVLDTSTGSGEWYRAPDGRRAHATTPVGTWRVLWQVNGWRTSQLGRLYRPKYFHARGIAVHGYSSVPPYPASHGCVRVTMAAMDMIWRDGLMPLRSSVRVY